MDEDLSEGLKVGSGVQKTQTLQWVEDHQLTENSLGRGCCYSSHPGLIFVLTYFLLTKNFELFSALGILYFIRPLEGKPSLGGFPHVLLLIGSNTTSLEKNPDHPSPCTVLQLFSTIMLALLCICLYPQDLMVQNTTSIKAGRLSFLISTQSLALSQSQILKKLLIEKSKLNTF